MLPQPMQVLPSATSLLSARAAAGANIDTPPAPTGRHATRSIWQQAIKALLDRLNSKLNITALELL